MSRKPNSSAISYVDVANACAELIKLGDTPSVRKLREQLGIGSFSTIQPHYHRWQDEQHLSQKVDTDISDALRQAILAEIGRATATLEQKMTESLGLEKNRLTEAQNLLLECETQIEKFKAGSDIAEQERLKLEKELTIAKALAEDNAKREKEYRDQIENLRQEIRQAELKAAVSDTKLSELEKQFKTSGNRQKDA